jgi:hypothetical protein
VRAKQTGSKSRRMFRDTTLGRIWRRRSWREVQIGPDVEDGNADQIGPNQIWETTLDGIQ